MKISKLQQKHKKILDTFSCGNIVIDNFLKNGAAFDDGIGKTYLLLSEDEKNVIGYYTISTGSMELS